MKTNEKKYSLKPSNSLNKKKMALFAIIVLSSACSDSGTKIASVGDIDVTQQQFDAYLKFKRINASSDTHKEKILNDYLQRIAMVEAIGQQNSLDVGLIKAELEEFRKEMMLSRHFESFLKNSISDDAVRNFYTANASQYEHKKAKVSHILLRTKKNMGEEERKVKLTTAQAAYSQLKTGKKFEQIAKEYSEDAISSKKGGDLGWLKQGSISKEFSDKVFALKPGQYTEPFESPFGYHIAMLQEGLAQVKQPFEAVKGDIRYKLRNKAKQAELERLQALVKVNRVIKK